MTIRPTDVLIIVDTQNDFVTGPISKPGNENIIGPTNDLIKAFDHVLVVKDWHPKDHISFASNHPGTKPGDRIDAPWGEQGVFVDHCVQGTPGAEVDPRLDLTKVELIFHKGYRASTESHGAFYEADGTPTGLGAYAKVRGFKRAYFTGLGRYGCVLQSAFGAAKDGFETFIVHDASAGDHDVEENDKLIAQAGIRWINSSDILAEAKAPEVALAG